MSRTWGKLIEMPECTCRPFDKDGQIYHFDSCPVAKLNWSHPEHKERETVPPDICGICVKEIPNDRDSCCGKMVEW